MQFGNKPNEGARVRPLGHPDFVVAIMIGLAISAGCSGDQRFSETDETDSDATELRRRARPQIAIDSPIANQIFAPGKVIVQGTASDAQTYPANVEIKVDDGTYALASATSSHYGTWSAELNVVSSGAHRILARATDTAGNQNWAEVTIAVSANTGGGAKADAGSVPTPADAGPTDPPKPTSGSDHYGFRKIYPTIAGGREWFLNMDNPTADGQFDPRADTTSAVTRNGDGTWRVNGGQVRMAVKTPAGSKEWRNVEVTGHYRIISGGEMIQTYARGEVHSGDRPCQGSAVKGRLHFNGTLGFIKELFHEDENNSGYTNEWAMVRGTTRSIVGRWVGFKYILYNVSNNTQAKMEAWLDDLDNNNWQKVTEAVDHGNWPVAALSDFNAYGNQCPNRDTGSRPLKSNEVITWAGGWISFRSDETTYDFRNLTAREIQPPAP